MAGVNVTRTADVESETKVTEGAEQATKMIIATMANGWELPPRIFAAALRIFPPRLWFGGSTGVVRGCTR